MPDYDTSHLLSLLRQHTSIPSAPGFDDEDCLRLLTAGLHGYVLAIVKADYQDHWLSADSVTTQLPLVDGQREYALPRRAVASSVRKAVLLDPQGKPHALRLAELDAAEERQEAPGQPRWYVPTAARFRLYPTPGPAMAGWSLRLSLLVRPARLVAPEDCAEVLTVTTVSGGEEVTIAAPVTGVTAVASLDVVRAQEPYEAVLLEATSAWAGDNVTVVLTVAAGTVQPGDYLCPAGVSPFAQCPVELLDLLAARTSVEQLASLGDASVSGAKAASLQERRKDAHTLVTPRTGEPRTRPNGMNKWRSGRGRSGWSEGEY